MNVRLGRKLRLESRIMTKVLVQGVGWVSIVVVRDWYTKAIVGHYAGLHCKAQHGLAALDMAVTRQFPEGAQGQGLSLMSDNGCQPATRALMEAFLGQRRHVALDAHAQRRVPLAEGTVGPD
jgi:transposase InsO family protein